MNEEPENSVGKEILNGKPEKELKNNITDLALQAVYSIK